MHTYPHDLAWQMQTAANRQNNSSQLLQHKAFRNMYSRLQSCT